MSTSTKAKTYLNKILHSEEFAKSSQYQKLLKYLVESSLDGKTPKEVTIAFDVFCSEVNHDKETDTKVRVYIHNLRKKLDSYYMHEGKDDELQFEIPKGNYRVRFIDKTKTIRRLGRNAILYTSIAALFTSILINIYLLQVNRSKMSVDTQIPKTNPVWEDYFESDLPILIVFGDYFLYTDTQIPERLRYVRDFQINSPDDLEQFLSANDSFLNHIGTTEHTFLGKLAPWSLYDLQSVLMPYNRQIELKLSTQLQWGDLNKYNILFVGTFKTLGILKELIKKLHVTYQVDPNYLFYHPENADTSYSYHATSSITGKPYETDYAVIAKISGANNNIITLFTSTRDIGCLAAVDFLAKPQFLMPFISENLKNDSDVKYFEAIFEVQGYERNVTNTKLLHFNVLHSQP
jgi:hypothetical protein